MQKFNDATHLMVQSEDGSYTAYSNEFKEHYHSTRDGALHESLYKHVIPALEHHKERAELTILDICFGLGFNTLATLYYMQKKSIYAVVQNVLTLSIRMLSVLRQILCSGQKSILLILHV
jgi:tRNA U34 5-methylaminomethyl-2-thiouridine-forming methyltransferase MnmC